MHMDLRAFGSRQVTLGVATSWILLQWLPDLVKFFFLVVVVAGYVDPLL